MKKILLITLIWGSTVFAWGLFKNIYTADTLLEDSVRYLSKGDTQVAGKLIDKAIELNGNEPNYYRTKAKILLVDAGDKAVILRTLQKALELNTHNLVTIRNSIPLYYFLASENIVLPSGADNIDEEYLLTTQKYYSFVKEKYSHDAGVIVSVAKYEKKLGLMDDYNASVEIIRKLRPDLLEWHDSFR
jgi:tetratricopeptide (TPR) repeat protein